MEMKNSKKYPIVIDKDESQGNSFKLKIAKHSNGITEFNRTKASKYGGTKPF